MMHYRYDKTMTEIIEQHVKKILQEGVIKNCHSPYCSPVVLCRKNNGKSTEAPEAWPVATDYRKLHKQTVYNNYPMLQIADLLQMLRGINYIVVRPHVWLSPDSKQERRHPRNCFCCAIGMLCFSTHELRLIFSTVHVSKSKEYDFTTSFG